jgi:hypothetical protein
MNALYKAILCFLRRFNKDDRINSAVAGALSALSLLIDNKERRKFLALIIFARSLVIILDSFYSCLCRILL